MRATVGPYTGEYPSTTTVLGEVCTQFVPEPIDHGPIKSPLEFNDFPMARSGNNPVAVAIGFAILIPVVIYGLFFT